METSKLSSGLARAAECPGCRAEIEFNDRLLMGETLNCETCGLDLEVSDPDPPFLILRVPIEETESDR